MKQSWERIALKINAMSLRERAMVFAAVAMVFIIAFNTFVLSPQLAKQKELSQRLKDDQAKIVQVQFDIQKKSQTQVADPDQESHTRLQALGQRFAEMQDELVGMQKRLVSPDKITELLEGILRRNGKLRLMSLKTLPVSALIESAPASTKMPAEAKSSGKNGGALALAKNKNEPEAPAGSIYKHGVELIVQGGYVDMVNYMAELEAMPWQLFWGKAALNVDEYPKATLTLTLFTLSLDKKWLDI